MTFFNNLVNYDLTSFEEFTDQFQKSITLHVVAQQDREVEF